MIIRILTYNIQDGGAGREELIHEVLEQNHADAILLQEVMDTEFVRRLASALNKNYFLALSNNQHQAALLTRFPITWANGFHPRTLTHPLLEATVEYAPGRSLYLFGIHLFAPAFDPTYEARRVKEIRRILNRIRELDTAPVIMAGDFNTIAPGDPVALGDFPPELRQEIKSNGGLESREAIAQVRQAGLVDAYRRLHPDEPGFTLPASRPDARLDFIFVDPGLADNIAGCEVVMEPELARRASDHLPVMMELEMNAT